MNHSRLEQNLRLVVERIAAACGRAGRDPAGVTLVAVTKTASAEAARALVALDVTNLGENRVQEAARKREALAGLGIRWHMIGHLQTNKAADAVQMFDLIHSVDSVRLVEALARRAAVAGRVIPVLVQVNVSGEATKSGVPFGSAVDEIRRMSEHTGVQIEGLMTMAPLVDDAETVRPVFRRLRELAEAVAALGLPRVEMKHLSMGMTQDYEVAVEEGATLVRVGTALFAGVE